MRNLIASCLLIAGISCSGFVHAEQGCPEGLAPIGRAPGPICVPQPGYGLGNPSAPAQSQQPSVPRPRWIDRWGAVSIDVVASKMGVATEKKSRREAQRTALKDCQARGGTAQECKKSLFTYGNGCGALALGSDYVAFDGGGTVEEATNKAQKLCSLNSTNCEVLYTRCSYPVLVN